MPSARQPAPAPRDRAERHVFGVLPDLPAVQRRVLALIELCEEPVASVAADLGIGEEAAREAAFSARRALRRLRAPLAGGSRCSRAERLWSDRIDAPLDRPDRKWLEIHVARCPRCAEHAELLAQARTELHVAFAAPVEKQLPPAPPEPPALEQGEPPRAQLRVVPPAPAVEPPAPAVEPPAPEPTPEPPEAVQDIEWTVDDAMRREVSTRRETRAVSPAAKRAARIVAIVLAIAALLAAAGYGLSQLGGGDHQRAPWSQPRAPDVRPAPLSSQ